MQCDRCLQHQYYRYLGLVACSQLLYRYINLYMGTFYATFYIVCILLEEYSAGLSFCTVQLHGVLRVQVLVLVIYRLQLYSTWYVCLVSYMIHTMYQVPVLQYNIPDTP